MRKIFSQWHKLLGIPSSLCHWLNNIFLIFLPSLKYTIISFRKQLDCVPICYCVTFYLFRAPHLCCNLNVGVFFRSLEIEHLLKEQDRRIKKCRKNEDNIHALLSWALQYERRDLSLLSVILYCERWLLILSWKRGQHTCIAVMSTATWQHVGTSECYPLH